VSELPRSLVFSSGQLAVADGNPLTGEETVDVILDDVYDHEARIDEGETPC